MNDAYDELALKPYVVARRVATQPYTGNEMSGGMARSFVERVESMRAEMTTADVRDFATAFDTLCREAHRVGAAWFTSCVRSKSNRGRDQLYVWAAHRLAAYLADKGGFTA